MNTDEIIKNTSNFIKMLPQGVTLIAAGKTRLPEELYAAYQGGVRYVGHNYVQEAERSIAKLGRIFCWHFIGHLQRNKAKKAARLFDMIETIDSVRIASALDQACKDLNKVMPILIEVNSAAENNKTGALHEKVEPLIAEIAGLTNLRIEGLMTMGPLSDNPEEIRPFFRRTKQLFEQLKEKKIPGVYLQKLSMGMSDSYRVAIEEGATMVRIGTSLFGPR